MKFFIILFIFFSTLYSDSCEDTLFAFDIPKKSSNIKIIDIVENMAYECRFSVKIKDDDVKKELEKVLFLVHIENYSLEDMFDFLFTQNNIFYKYDKNKNVLSLSYLETKSFVIDYINLSKHMTASTKNILIGSSSSDGDSSSSGSTSNSDETIVTSETEFNFWKNLKENIDNALSLDNSNKKSNKNSIVNIETGVITVTGNINQINLVENYIKKIMDRLHKQVMLEVKLFEVSYEDSKSFGIDWSSFQDSVNSVALKSKFGESRMETETITEENGVPITTVAPDADYHNGFSYDLNYNFSMTNFINFLDSYGDVNVISTPKVMTLNNQPAVINVGEQYNYQYSEITTDTDGGTQESKKNDSSFIGLTLNILPEITEDGFVILRMNPVVSSIIKLYNDRAPDIKIKQLSSIIKAKDGARVVTGGLVSYSSNSQEKKVRGLGDIPILGYAFKNESDEIIKKELIIVVTPTVIDYDNFPSIESIESLLSVAQEIKKEED
ncbi:MAG: hypothetical protein U9N02_01265 [Campylobacterota bacterium]|nr:hypothetical protein [Campylobacterota bacterium]